MGQTVILKNTYKYLFLLFFLSFSLWANKINKFKNIRVESDLFQKNMNFDLDFDLFEKPNFLKNRIFSKQEIFLEHYGELKPAYKLDVLDQNPRKREKIWLDAQNSQILWREPVNRFFETYNSPAKAFKHSADLNLEPKEVTLENLLSNTEGSFLSGQYLKTKNGAYFVTYDPSDTNKKNPICSSPNNPKAELYHELLALSANTLGVAEYTDAQTLFIDTVKSPQLPCAKRSSEGFFETVFDGYTLEAETDHFAEVQAYYSATEFFKYIRELAEKSNFCPRELAEECNFCLRELAMNCETQNIDNVKSLEILVNQMLPDIFTHTDSLNPILAEIKNGKGLSPNTPIEVNSLIRLANAAFIPALEQPDAFEENLDDKLGDLYKPYDRLVFFQGLLDYVLDGSIVFHEFMHAVTQTLAPFIRFHGIDSWGAHVEPGALGEAWADYFSASFTGNPNIGEYTAKEAGYDALFHRSLNNSYTCSENLVGEVHEDSLIVSGALWEIRQAFKEYGLNTKIWDKIIFKAIKNAFIFETFASFSERLIAALAKEGSVIRKKGLPEKITEILEQRELRDCQKIYTLVKINSEGQVEHRSKSALFQKAPLDFGIDNYLPAPVILKFTVPENTESISLNFARYFDSSNTLLSTELNVPEAGSVQHPQVIINEGTPHRFTYQNRTTTAFSQGQIVAPLDMTQNQDKTWGHTKTLTLNSCGPRTFYVSILSLDHAYVYRNITSSFKISQAGSQSDTDCSANGGDNNGLSEFIASGGSESNMSSDAKKPSCAATQSGNGLGLFSNVLILLAFLLINRLFRQLQ